MKKYLCVGGGGIILLIIGNIFMRLPAFDRWYFWSFAGALIGAVVAIGCGVWLIGGNE